MKKITCFLFLCFVVALSTNAQPTNKMNYQAVARNSSGNILASQLISIRLTIEDGSGGTPLYVETHSTTTNQFGLFTLQIGGGTVVSGTYSAIAWANGNQWLKVEMDPTGGNTYTNMGESQLLSVPFANYAASGGSGGTVTGTGTPNVVPLWTTPTNVADSRMQQDASSMWVFGNASRTPALGVYPSTTSDAWGIVTSNYAGATTDGTAWDYFDDGGGGIEGINEVTGAYRSGVHGTVWFDVSNNLAGVIGTNQANTTFGALSYKDNVGVWSGVYGSTATANNAINGNNGNTTSGTGWAPSANYSAVHGEGAVSGDFQAGVYGYQIGLGANAGGVVGAYASNIWGGLGYSDAASQRYGVYSSGKAYVGGVLQVVDGTQGNGRVFVSDASGNGSWSNSISFNANTSSTAPIALDAAVIFGTEVYDNGGNNYDPATGKFTAPVDGVYHFDSNMMGVTSATADFDLALITSTFLPAGAVAVATTAGTTKSLNLSVDITLLAGQSVWVITENTGGTFSPNGNSYFNSFTGHLVR